LIQYKNRPYHIPFNPEPTGKYTVDGIAFRDKIVKYLEENAVHSNKKFVLNPLPDTINDMTLYPISQLIDLLIFYDYQDFGDYLNYFTELNIVMKKNFDELVAYGRIDMISYKIVIMLPFGERITISDYRNVKSIIDAFKPITSRFDTFGIKMDKIDFDKFFEYETA
jgi:hypothetical protein